MGALQRAITKLSMLWNIFYSFYYFITGKVKQKNIYIVIN